MDERSFLVLLRRRWLVVVLVGLAGVLASLGYLLLVTPVYTARTELFVAAVGGNSASDLAQGSDYSQEQARNYAVVATRQAVLDPVISELQLDTTRTELATRIRASVPLNTSLITITVEDPSPEVAADIANAVGTSLTDAVGTLVPRRTDGTLPVRLQSIQEATPPESPSAPNIEVVLAAGAIGGLVLGIALVALRELTGGRIRTPEQAAQVTGLPLLGKISVDRQHDRQPVAVGARHWSRRAEEFRTLRTNLHFLRAADPQRFFVFTSSVPGEGKSSVSVNTAVALAATPGSRVCLVEADLRRPQLGGVLDLEDAVGLTTVLAGEATLDEALQEWGSDGLHVLLAGHLPPNPSELLGSEVAQRVLTELGERFDAVVIDSPPLSAVTDAAVIATEVGGAVLVVGCGKVQTREANASVRAMEAAGGPLLGMVANFAPDARRDRYTGSYETVEEPGPR